MLQLAVEMNLFMNHEVEDRQIQPPVLWQDDPSASTHHRRARFLLLEQCGGFCYSLVTNSFHIFSFSEYQGIVVQI